MARILVFRSGGLGDFLVTLPALDLLRRNNLDADIELVGHPRWACLAAEGRQYLNRVHSIDRAFWAPLFHAQNVLPSPVIRYLADIDLAVSFLGGSRDDDLARNLLDLGFKLVDPARRHPPEPGERLFLPIDPNVRLAPASAHFCEPFRGFGWEQDNFLPRLYLNTSDHQQAFDFLKRYGLGGHRFVAIHPGSGSRQKNWPLERWIETAERIQAEQGVGILWILGEAEEQIFPTISSHASKRADRAVAFGLPTPLLGAIAARAVLYLGHDTGVSHLAGAAGAAGIVLFGATDPEIWAPAGSRLSVVSAPNGLDQLEVGTVLNRVSEILASQSPISA